MFTLFLFYLRTKNAVSFLYTHQNSVSMKLIEYLHSNLCTMQVPVSKEFLKSAPLVSFTPAISTIADEFLFIKQGTAYHKVRIGDITYLESDNVYINVHVANNKYLVRSTLDQYLEILNSNQFVRVHRSYVVNINYIDAIDANHLIVNKVCVPTRKTYKNELLKSLRLG